MGRWQRNCLAVLTAGVVAACSGSTAPSATLAPTPSPSPTASIDPALSGAVADALATIDEIDRLYKMGAGDATFGLISEVAGKGRTSLSREPARVTTMEAFQVYDLTLQKLGLDYTLLDGAALVEDHDWLVFTVRQQIADLVK